VVRNTQNDQADLAGCTTQGNHAGEMFRKLERSYRESIRRDDLMLALADCEALVDLGGGDAETWYNLGYLRRCARRYHDALTAYSRALELGLHQPEHALLNRAAILLDQLARPEAAVSELNRAIDINPRFLQAWLNLGQAFEDLGRANDAIHAYRQVLALRPESGRALARSIALGEFPGDCRKTLSRALSNAPAGSDDAAEIAMALAQNLEQAGEYEGAFAAMKQANQIVLDLTPDSQRYAADTTALIADRAIASSSPTTCEPKVTSDPKLVFVLGMLRSGSTLVERILARHSQVRTIGEFEAIPALAAALWDKPNSFKVMSEADRRRLAREYLDEAEAIVGPFSTLVDKRPDNFLHVPLIKALFPTARIINTVRNPRDIMISIFGNLFGPGVPFASRLRDIADWQAHHDRLMRVWVERWPAAIHVQSYENLVADPRREVSRLLDFCGLRWEEQCLDPAGASGPIQTLSQWQVREPIHRRSVGRAEAYAELIERALGEAS
jgi:tetratricopeptide (TPR) repeat protein